MLSILLPLLLAHGAPTPPPEEVKYLQTRDAYIAQLAKNPKNAQALDQSARAKLEAQLRQIIGPARVDGFAELGKLNLETLVKDDPGFGQVDGLLFVNGHERLFVTTPFLLDKFLKSLPGKTDHADFVLLDDFYSKVFSWDLSFTIMADVPYRKSSLYDMAHGLLMLTAQDIGDFPAKDLVAVALRNDRVYVWNADLPEPGLRIPRCSSVWRKANAGGDGDKAFAAYKKCWKESAKDQSFFPALQNRVDEIVGRLR